MKTYLQVRNAVFNSLDGHIVLGRGKGKICSIGSQEFAVYWHGILVLIINADDTYQYCASLVPPTCLPGLKSVLTEYGPIAVTRRGAVLMNGDVPLKDGIYDAIGRPRHRNAPPKEFLTQPERLNLLRLNPVLEAIIYGDDGEYQNA